MEYPTVENAYQAAKTEDKSARIPFQEWEPGKAKRQGKQLIRLRWNWDRIKLRVMKKLIQRKFQDKILRRLLLATGDQELVEGNYWGDQFWGVCNGKGLNHLGRILMEVREQIRKDSEA